MSISLYRKYRPQTFSDVIGQKHIVQTLSNAIKNNRAAHAYLFTGPRGTGKTTMARIFARAVNCSNPKDANPCLECEICKNISEGKSLDIFEIDAASNTGVDNIRELRENVKFPPTLAKYKVYIIDEVHMLSSGAFNALLKTLEEPPRHVIFILATTEIHKVPETIISRCQRFDFVRLPLDNIVEKLSKIAKSEKIEIEKNALEMIAISAEGGMRDAESLFAQVISLEDKKVTTKEVENILGTTKWESLEKLSENIFKKNAQAAIELVDKLSTEGYDLEIFNKSFLNYLRQLMLVSVDESLSKVFSHELTKEQARNLALQAKGIETKEVLRTLGCFLEIQGKIRSAFIPQLPLEIAIVKSIGKEEKEEKTDFSEKSEPFAKTTPITSPKAPETPKNASILPSQVKSDISPAQENAASNSQKIKPQIPVESVQFSLNDVRKKWSEILAEIKSQNHSIAATLGLCQPTSISGSTLNIAAKFGFHKDKLNEHGNKLTMEASFAKILGSQVKIQVVTAEEAGVKLHSAIENHGPKKVEEKSKETSSLLSDALGIIGGTIVE